MQRDQIALRDGLVDLDMQVGVGRTQPLSGGVKAGGAAHPTGRRPDNVLAVPRLRMQHSREVSEAAIDQHLHGPHTHLLGIARHTPHDIPLRQHSARQMRVSRLFHFPGLRFASSASVMRFRRPYRV